jgi:hypothetical protein
MTLRTAGRRILRAVAVIAPQALEATGWVATDSSGRYWRHELRYGADATFDLNEITAIESRRRGGAAKPRRAPACRCPQPFGRLNERVCWLCGRRVA